MRTGQLTVCALLVVAGCAHNRSAEERTVSPSASEDRNVVADAPRATTTEPEIGRATPARERELDNGSRTPSESNPVVASEGSADNTRVNERDRGQSTLTPMDQGGSESDRDLVQRIRKAVVADDSLSFNAKNVKIITRDGEVTLRGAVNNARERSTIEKTARAAAGTGRVTNELEVAH